MRLLAPRYYNGALSDSNRTDMDVLRYLRLAFRSARVYGTDTLPTLTAYNARLDAALAAGGGAVPLSMHYMQYATIRPDALQNNLLRVQGEQVYDVAGRAQNPYLTQGLFAAAPVLSFARTNSVAFVPRRNLFLTNTAIPVQQLQVDFGDGRGYQAAAWNQAISTVYTSAGLKRVKVKITFASTIAPQESWFDFNVLSVVAAARGTTASSDFEQPFPSNATHSGGIACVIFGNTAGTKHTQLTKPFIISEGYNLYDIAPELRKCKNPNNDIDAFFSNIGLQNTGPFDFRTQLLNAGYDIVYIDNTKGSDDITRNAQLFEAVVRWVNLNKVGGKASGQQNVVMGQSMGGLVSRYGLAEMTKRGNDDPHTRLLVLHDSPQRGAYNPVGVQSLGRSFDVPFLFGNSLADLNGQVRATVRVLNQPATQQLSILNAFDGRSTIRPNTFIPNTYQPMIAFSGRPPYDIVAVSNGSQCGRPQNTPVGVTISQSSLALLLPIPYVGLAGLTGDFGSYGLPAYGQQATVSRVSLRLEYQIRIGFCPFCVTIPIRFNLLRESAQSPANTLPYETLPGGSTNPYQQAGSCADGFDFGSLNGIYAAYFRNNLYNGDLCFVPSYSALDVATVTPTTAFAKYVNNSTDNPSPPRVDRYIAQESVNGTGGLFNVAHISFTPRNSEWIYNEMQRPFNGNANTVGCTTECTSPLTIVSSLGYQRICRGTSVTFSIPGLPAGTVVNWSAAPADNFTVASGSGPTFTTAASSIATGNSTITATVGPCGASASLTVPTGPGEPKGYYTSGYGNGTLSTVQRLAYPGANGVDVGVFINDPYNFTFTADLPGLYLTSTQGTSTHFILKPGQGVTITATATNAPCGLVGRFAFICPSGPYSYRLAPNPADTELKVTAVEDDQSANSAAAAVPFDADLYDSRGKKVKTKKSDKGKAVLDVRELPAGLYHLRAGKGKEALSEQIQITY